MAPLRAGAGAVSTCCNTGTLAESEKVAFNEGCKLISSDRILNTHVPSSSSLYSYRSLISAPPPSCYPFISFPFLKCQANAACWNRRYRDTKAGKSSYNTATPVMDSSYIYYSWLAAEWSHFFLLPSETQSRWTPRHDETLSNLTPSRWKWWKLPSIWSMLAHTFCHLVEQQAHCWSVREVRRAFSDPPSL